MKKLFHQWARNHPGMVSIIFPRMYRRFVDYEAIQIAASEYGAQPDAEYEVERLRKITRVDNFVRKAV